MNYDQNTILNHTTNYLPLCLNQYGFQSIAQHNNINFREKGTSAMELNLFENVRNFPSKRTY